MITNEILGNVYEQASNDKVIEWIELEWDELNKRVLRKKTDKGTDVKLAREDDAPPLRVGDIVFEDDEKQVVVRTKEEDAYVVYPKSIIEMGKCAFELGNRHTPCLISAEEIVVRYDQTLKVLFEKVGVVYERTPRRFTEPLKYGGHHH